MVNLFECYPFDAPRPIGYMQHLNLFKKEMNGQHLLQRAVGHASKGIVFV